MYLKSIHGKNNFAEGSKILLDTDLKIILLNHQNNFVETLNVKKNNQFNLICDITILAV